MIKMEQIETNIYQDIKNILADARNNIAKTVNSEMVLAYWNIGKLIHEVQDGKERAEYGSGLIKSLSEKLTEEFGKGFDSSNLRRMRQLYQTFPNCGTVSHQFKNSNCGTLWSKLSWSHLTLIMRLLTQEKREFYVKEAAECNWSVRQLERQINSSYYERLLSTPNKNKEEARCEIHKLEPNNLKPLDILKDPYVLEFLDLPENQNFLEKDLEKEIADNLQSFLLELGKGFTFVGRQKRISFEDEHFYIDLVFYNIILRCYVLIDLKKGKLTHQDLGQMDMYINYFDEEIKQENDNPTVGIVLCSEKNNAVVKYSTLNDSKRLFISKYMNYLPSEEELTNYLKRERELLERKYLKIK